MSVGFAALAKRAATSQSPARVTPRSPGSASEKKARESTGSRPSQEAAPHRPPVPELQGPRGRDRTETTSEPGTGQARGSRRGARARRTHGAPGGRRRRR